MAVLRCVKCVSCVCCRNRLYRIKSRPAPRHCARPGRAVLGRGPVGWWTCSPCCVAGAVAEASEKNGCTPAGGEIRAGLLRGLPHGILEAEPGATYASVVLRGAVALVWGSGFGCWPTGNASLSTEAVVLPSISKLPRGNAGGVRGLSVLGFDRCRWRTRRSRRGSGRSRGA
jgi:hypothetical protein